MGVIAKEEFVTIMNNIMIASDKSREIDDQLSAIPIINESMDFFSCACLIMSNTHTVVSLLETMFDDKEDQWIEYWMYEMDYGRQWEKDCVIGPDGESIDLQTPESLYDFLIKNMSE